MRKPDASLKIEPAATIGVRFGYGLYRSSSIRKHGPRLAWTRLTPGSPQTEEVELPGASRAIIGRSQRPRGESTVHLVLRELRTEVREKFEEPLLACLKYSCSR